MIMPGESHAGTANNPQHNSCVAQASAFGATEMQDAPNLNANANPNANQVENANPTQVDTLNTLTQLTEAIKAGDMDQAQQLYDALSGPDQFEANRALAEGYNKQALGFAQRSKSHSLEAFKQLENGNQDATAKSRASAAIDLQAAQNAFGNAHEHTPAKQDDPKVRKAIQDAAQDLQDLSLAAEIAQEGTNPYENAQDENAQDETPDANETPDYGDMSFNQLVEKAKQADEQIAELEKKVGQVTKPTPKGQHVHAHFYLLEICYLNQLPAYLFGPPGSGKSHAAVSLAQKYPELGTPLFECLTPQTGKWDLFGGISPVTGDFIATNFYHYWKNGGLIAIDECDNASPELLVALNQAIESRSITFANGETIQQHDNCYIVAQGNTDGLGANPMFPGRKKMDGAFRARFFFIEWNWDEKLEKKLVLSINQDAKAMLTWAWQARTWIAQYAPHIILGPRETMRLAKLMSHIEDRKQLVHSIIWKGAKKDQLSALLKAHAIDW